MLGARKSLVAQIVKAPRVLSRSFSRTQALREAQVLDMPSMSPTMEEGGIVEWKVQPGGTFKAGDVLLEIETDKAEIAVEAADDGVLAKILVEAGQKGIPVGRPIAVTAEEGDDISGIDYNALVGDAKSASAEPAAAEPAADTSSASSSKAASETPSSSSPLSSSSAESATVQPPAHSHGNHGTEPLPSALRLIHEHHLNVSDIQGSGPFGRITKGDVLAHLGKIPKEYPATEQARFNKLEKMDLSNVEIAPPKPAEAGANAGAKNAAPEKPKPLVTSVSIPLIPDLVPKVAAAQRVALRKALLSQLPRPSVLRDAVLDNLTAPTTPPFVVKSAKVTVLRAKPVSLDVVVEEPPAEKPSKAVNVFFEVLTAELSTPSA